MDDLSVSPTLPSLPKESVKFNKVNTDSSIASSREYQEQKIPSDPIIIPETDEVKIISKKEGLSIQEKAHTFTEHLITTFEFSHEPIELILENTAAHVHELEAGITVFKGFNVFVNLPLTVYNIYSMAKNWKKTSHSEKAMEGSSILHSQIITAGGLASIVKEIPHIPVAAEIGAAKAAGVLGPLGLWLGASLMTIKGTAAARRAYKLANKIKAIDKFPKASRLTENGTEGFIGKLLNRERVRFLNFKKFESLSSVQYFFLAAGLTAAAIVATLATAGVIIGLTATPIGWAALGILAVGGIIGLGVYAYRRYYGKQKAEEEQKGFAKEIYENLQAQPHPSMQWNTVQALEQMRDQFKTSQTIDKKQLAKLLTQSILGEKSTLSFKDQHHSSLFTEAEFNRWITFLKNIGLEMKSDRDQILLLNLMDDSYQKQHSPAYVLENFIEKELEISLSVSNKKAQKDVNHLTNQLIKKAIESNLTEVIQELIANELNEAKKYGHYTTESLKGIIGVTTESLSKEDIKRYAREVTISSTWPKNPNLVRTVMKHLKTQKTEDIR